MDRNCDRRSSQIRGEVTQSLVNMIPGQVRAIHRSPLNVGIRVRVGERTDLSVGWLWGSLVTAALGYDVSVTVVIPADAIHLEFGYFILGKRR